MAKISQEQRNRYFEKVKEHKATIDAILAREKTLVELLAKEEGGASFKRLHLCEEMLDLASWHLLVNSLSLSLLGIKNEDMLIDGRKVLVRALKYLEDVVTLKLDAPFSDYEKNLDDIKDIDIASRFRLVRKIGFAIESFEAAFGENSKYSRGFNEIWGKLAALAKNLIDLRTLMAELDFNSPNREVMKAHLAFVKDLFKRTADRYREEYELYTHKLTDFKIAIQFLAGLRRLLLILGERDEAEKLKRNIEVWNSKLDADFKKTEKER
ncbi:MAG TPA: hypothetical protein VMV44_05380 [Rectinemataceae bacterium]|nr:hypothetical protein [Rectinemataceae bacterium]